MTKLVVTWSRLPDMGTGEAQHSHHAADPPQSSGGRPQILTLLVRARFIT